MWLSIMSVIVMGAMFLYMVNKAKFAVTRRMALIPLGACVMEALATGLLTPLAFPILTLVLVTLRLIILTCCVGAIRQDAVMARNRVRRRSNPVRASITVMNEQSNYCPRPSSYCA